MPPEIMCPAVGQGALAIEIRRNDDAVRAGLQFMDHAETRAAVECERALLGGLGGGCQVPVGALAVKNNDYLLLTAMAGRPDGTQVLREQRSGNDPVKLGREVGQMLLGRGADKILKEIYGQEAAAPVQP